EAAQRRDQQRQRRHQEQCNAKVDAPALRRRVKPVEELVQMDPHEHPAGAVAAAILPAAADESRLQPQPLQQRRHHQPPQPQPQQGKPGVERRGEQIAPGPGQHGGGSLGYAHGQRSARATGRLYQFIKAAITRLMVRYTAMVTAITSTAWPVWFSTVPANTDTRSG